MARPIQETPILKGKAAVQFLSDMNKIKEKKITPEALEKIKTNSEKLRSISKFLNGPDKF